MKQTQRTPLPGVFQLPSSATQHGSEASPCSAALYLKLVGNVLLSRAFGPRLHPPLAAARASPSQVRCMYSTETEPGE